MKITSVILRRRLFGSVKGAWSKPMLISDFVHKFSDNEVREKLLDDHESIKFVTADGEILDYAKGHKEYQISEKYYLDSLLDATFNQLGSLSLS